MDFLKLIKKEGYIPLSYELNKKLGLTKSVVLTYLIQKYLYLRRYNRIQDEFYCNAEELENKIALPILEIKSIFDDLQSYDLISCYYQDEKWYFTIYEKNITEYFRESNKLKLNFKQDQAVDDLNKADDNKNYLSDKTLKLFSDLYGKNMPKLTQKELLSIINDDDVVSKAIEISGKYSPDKTSYIFKVLKDWKGKGLVNMKKLENYLYMQEIGEDEGIEITTQDYNAIEEICFNYNDKNKSIFSDKKNVTSVYFAVKKNGWKELKFIKKVFKEADESNCNIEEVLNEIGIYISYAKGYR